MDENTNSSDGSELKYRGLKSGYENYYKKISGQIDGANNYKLLETEKIKWTQFLDFVENRASDSSHFAEQKRF